MRTMIARRYLAKSSRLAAMLGSLGIALVVGVHSAPAQTAQYDGVYKGTQTLTDDPNDHNYSKCLKGPFKRQMVVKDGAATYTYNPTYQGQVVGTIAADGTITGSEETSAGGVALVGKIDGDQFTGKVWSIICTYTLDLKRVP
ncbi:MAG TPA: hypothetical protein VGR70_00175 [Stellaceae bacterium]|nr:hypothetical protein [Stellaceae bacterium]